MDVLKGIDLTVRRGELIGLLGPNGAGKTTLLKSMATLVIPDRGSICIDGIDIARYPLQAKRKIGLCSSEEKSFYARLSARVNLDFFAALFGFRGRQKNRRIEEVLDLVDLHEHADQRVSTFSSGMRQRLTIARALLGDPEILLLDEPTRAVDPLHAETLRIFFRERLMRDLGKTVVLATNILDEAWRLCDRIAIVNGGKITALGPPRSLDRGVRRVNRYEIIVDAQRETLHLVRLEEIPGIRIVEVFSHPEGSALTVDVDGSASNLQAFLSHLGSIEHSLRSFRSIDISPFDVFMRITTNEHA